MSTEAKTVRADVNRLGMLLYDQQQHELAIELASEKLSRISEEKSQILFRLLPVLPVTGDSDNDSVLIEDAVGQIIEIDVGPDVALNARMRASTHISRLPEYSSPSDAEPSHSVNPDVPVMSEHSLLHREDVD